MTDADREALAGEFVLGLMTAEETEAFERRLHADAGIAASVAGWRERFYELDAAAPAVTPSPDLWRRIDQALDRTPPAAVAPRPSRLGHLWTSLTLWRGVGLAGAAASLALALALGAALTTSDRTPTVIAVLLTADAVPGAVVEVYGDGSAFVAPLSDVNVPAGRALQVWTLPDPAGGPVSIGLMPENVRAYLTPAALPPPKPRQLYEITLEPASGSPTGRPTGPILFKGYAEPPR